MVDYKFLWENLEDWLKEGLAETQDCKDRAGLARLLEIHSHHNATENAIVSVLLFMQESLRGQST